MISHEEFGRLRLTGFLEPEHVSPLEDWRYEDADWVGDAHGFSEWLRLAEHAEVTGSIALDFSSLPAEAATKVMVAIELPVRPGMTFSEITEVLGEPTETMAFVKDRKTYGCTTGDVDTFIVSCTVLDSGGLSYLTIMRPLESY